MKNYHQAFFIQFAIISNHQNGRDTHIRQIQVFSPKYFLDKEFQVKCDRERVLNRWLNGHFLPGEIDIDTDLKLLKSKMFEGSGSKSRSKSKSSSGRKSPRSLSVHDIDPRNIDNSDIFEDSPEEPVEVEDYFRRPEKFRTIEMLQYSGLR